MHNVLLWVQCPVSHIYHMACKTWNTYIDWNLKKTYWPFWKGNSMKKKRTGRCCEMQILRLTWNHHNMYTVLYHKTHKSLKLWFLFNWNTFLNTVFSTKFIRETLHHFHFRVHICIHVFYYNLGERMCMKCVHDWALVQFIVLWVLNPSAF